jgi:hypothetical protein
VQSSAQVPEPDSLHEQLLVHSSRLHIPLPEHCMLHPLPAHDRTAVPEESPRTVQPPAGHEKEQVPLPWQTNSQPEPGHAREQGSDVTQKHGVPGVQLVEFEVCVVATHATRTDRLTTRPARRITSPPGDSEGSASGRPRLSRSEPERRGWRRGASAGIFRREAHDAPAPPTLDPVTARLRWTVVVAVAVHLGAFAWTFRAGDDSRGSRERQTVIETDVELVEPPPEPEPRAAATDEPPVASPPSGAVAHPDERRGSPAPGDGSGGHAPAEQPAASSGPAASDGSWTFSPTTTGGGSGGTPLAGSAWNDAVGAGVRATVAEARPDPRRRQVLPAYSARDIALGLAPGGALATLTKDFVRRSRVPTVGHALLRLDSDSAGIIASVHLLDVSAGRPEWDEVAAQIVAAARQKPLRVPAGARGVSVTIDVTSAMKTVDGATPSNSTVGKALGILGDPVGAALGAAAHEPLVHVVAARIVDVSAF